MSKVTVIAGGKGTGKTKLVRERLMKVHPKSILINDVNNEYSDILKTSYIPVKEFTALASSAENAVVVFEEATIFFSNRGGQSEKMKELLVRSRHTKNMIFLVFHSLRSVPKDIYDLINYMIIFKTNDNLKIIEKKFEVPELTQCVERVNIHKDIHYHEIFETQGNFTHE